MGSLTRTSVPIAWGIEGGMVRDRDLTIPSSFSRPQAINRRVSSMPDIRPRLTGSSRTAQSGGGRAGAVSAAIELGLSLDASVLPKMGSPDVSGSRGDGGASGSGGGVVSGSGAAGCTQSGRTLTGKSVIGSTVFSTGAALTVALC